MAGFMNPDLLLKQLRERLAQQAAVGGYATGGGNAGNGAPSTGIPPGGGSPYPYNTMTGGVGYNLNPGGYNAKMPTAGRADTPMGPSQLFMPRRMPNLMQMPRNTYQSAYQGGYTR
jgi:hypothetical protein